MAILYLRWTSLHSGEKHIISTVYPVQLIQIINRNLKSLRLAWYLHAALCL